MSLQNDLLELAQELVNRGKTKPKQASLRRAVSTAYYALFHLLVAEASKKLVPGSADALRSLVSRAFDHGNMKKLCGSYASGGNLPAALQAISPPPVPHNLARVARIFKDLQEARHGADYDLAETFTRADALTLVQQAETAFAAWDNVRDTEQARIFLTALLLSEQWKR